MFKKETTAVARRLEFLREHLLPLQDLLQKPELEKKLNGETIQEPLPQKQPDIELAG